MTEQTILGEPCPTCGHRRKVCALCRGTGVVTVPIPGSSSLSGSVREQCPNGCWLRIPISERFR